MTVNRDDKVRPRREVAIDGPDPDAGLGSDVTNRRVDAGGDEDSGGSGEERLFVALSVGPLGSCPRRRWLAYNGHCALLPK
jgi:hypothetical protein